MSNINTYTAIMAGGAGTRFWPSSTENTPKQFLDIMGMGKSLLRLTYERFLKLCPSENIFIVSNEKYRSLIKKQIPELSNNQIIGEPSRNNTGPCVAYTAFKAFKTNPNANLVVAPSDHLIINEDDFIEYIKKGLDFIRDNNTIATLGLKPTRPATGYGYIKFGDKQAEGINLLEQFTEKPDLDTAKSFMDSGEYLWNSGIFLFRAKYILEEFKNNAPDIYSILAKGIDVYNTEKELAFINEHYPTTQNISFDYAIMEKTKGAVTIPADLNWSDLGTWTSLFEIAEKDNESNVKQGEIILKDCQNTFARVPANQIAVIKGLEDYIVVNENNVLLIYPKSEEQAIKQERSNVEDQFGEQFI